MNKIKILDDHLANLIAAGEVVIDPYSVIKELVENSIDAQSSVIKIDLDESGFNHIIIEDNGIGMSSDDALMCINRHATSKIKSEFDLNHIGTLGFRGEAVTSIAAVSKFKIETNNGDDNTTVVVDGGKLVNSTNSSSVKKGTRISVHNLFFNTPARLKHQSNSRYQFSLIKEYVYQMSFINPDIEFVLVHNNELLFQSIPNDLTTNVAQIYGLEVAKNILNVEASSVDFDINGYFIDPKYSKPNKKAIILSINKRLIWSNKLNNAITDSLEKYLMVGKFPICYFNIEVDPSIIDVNIHPQKKQVKISKEDKLIELLTNEIIDTYKENFKVFEASIEKKKTKVVKTQAFTIDVSDNTSFDNIIKSEENTTANSNEPEVSESNYDVHSFASEKVEYDSSNDNESSQTFIEFNSRSYSVNNLNQKRNNLEQINYIGQYLNSYLIGQSGDKIVLVDQHAAMERINYELNVIQLSKNEKYYKSLVIPIKIDINESDVLKVEDSLEVLKELGIELDVFGTSTLLLRKIPSYINSTKVEKFINLLLEYVLNSKNISKQSLINEIAIIKACKLSIKANQMLNRMESEKLFNSLYYVENYTQCPHGRPILIYLSKYEIEKMFKRVV